MSKVPRCNPLAPLSVTVTRRQVLRGTGALAATYLIGCTGTLSDGRGDTLSGDDMSGGDAANAAPVWQTIPDQTWVVGVPVMLDLADFCTDANGDPLTFQLDGPLPAGVNLNGSVISGTPTAEAAATAYVATADDGV